MQNRKYRKIVSFILSLTAIVLPWLIILSIDKEIVENNASGEIEIINFQKDSLTNRVDHSQFEILQQEFTEASQVTEACISCHNERHHEVMSSSHWNWDRETVRANGDTVMFGKKDAINNFCISITSNTWKCTSCHAGYGWKDNTFDFGEAKNVDCIVCHDNTGSYKKDPLGSGMPLDKKIKSNGKVHFPVKLGYVAQNVGTPTVDNCGKCHFYGGGGDNVKHGDLSSDLYHADKNMDVHMDQAGNNMSCVDCHETNQHNMEGKVYSVSSANKDRMSCQKCHTDAPHVNNTLNKHTEKVACQTCHIPEYAKGVPTKMNWDWSTTGRLDENGEAILEKDSTGMVVYKSAKGSFEWATHVKPEYVWFNGKAEHYMAGDLIEDTTAVLQINTLLGEYNDADSKIIPVKVHRGKQIIDPVNKMLITPHVYGHDSTAYGEGFNWVWASAAGMKESNLPFSGEYSFISTEMYWPINHMVSPSGESLTCIECHSRDGLLANVDGFYMPGRDFSATVDILGILMVLLSLSGVAIHGLIRYIKKDCIACD